MSNLKPANYPTRCFHYRTLISEGAQFKKYNNGSIAADYGVSIDQEVLLAKNLGVADLSPLPRTGFKGREAVNWLRAQGLEIGDLNNQVYMENDGVLVARLTDTEVLILNALHIQRNLCISLEKNYSREQPVHCYSVPRFDSSAWLLITGQCASSMFAKLCGVDLRQRKFSNDSIAQTSIARINGIIIRNDLGGTPAFHLIFDSASTDYVWSCLKDAFSEFEGAPIGYNAICQLQFS